MTTPVPYSQWVATIDDALSFLSHVSRPGEITYFSGEDSSLDELWVITKLRTRHISGLFNEEMAISYRFTKQNMYAFLTNRGVVLPPIGQTLMFPRFSDSSLRFADEVWLVENSTPERL